LSGERVSGEREGGWAGEEGASTTASATASATTSATTTSATTSETTIATTSETTSARFPASSSSRSLRSHAPLALTLESKESGCAAAGERSQWMSSAAKRARQVEIHEPPGSMTATLGTEVREARPDL
jgi:hypothetical protein